jgi:hypothetical protein
VSLRVTFPPGDLSTDALPPTPQGDAPPGEKFGLGGWLRVLGFQGSARTAPPRGWRRHLVALVSDESELAQYSPGPRGTVGGVQAGGGTLLAFQFRAGNAGCRARFTLGEVTGGAGYQVSYAVIDAIALVGPTTLVVTWSDTRRLGETTGQRGTLAAAPLTNQASIAVPAGGSVTAPDEVWIAPGRALVFWGLAAGGAAALTVHLREPGSLPG